MSDPEREQKDREISELKRKIAQLNQQLDFLTRQLFGKKSEKGIPDHPDQPDLFADQDWEDDEPSSPEGDEQSAHVDQKPKSKRTKKKKKPRLPDDLPIEETVVDPEEVLASPQDWKEIGNPEISDRLAYEPPRYYIKRITRRKYVRRESSRAEPSNPPVIAPLPPQFIEGGILDYTFAAHVVISKYGDHLPLDRQSKINRERHQIDISKQTLCNTVGVVADWLQLIVAEMSRKLFDSGYVQGDETPIKYLKPGAGSAQQGYLWTMHSPGGDTVYHWRAGRSTDCLRSIVPQDFKGILQCDGYQAYPKLASERDITLCSCLAHIRRKFHEALEQQQDPVFNNWVMRQIQLLYKIEAELREAKASASQRHARRQSQSRIIYNRIEKAIKQAFETRRFLPQSLTGKAISYALNQWRNLSTWLEDGRVEIDNNLVENKIRPTKLGAKNWLFVGAEKAGWKTAVIYTVITSCRNHGIEPFAYLVDVLSRLPRMKTSEISDIIPSNWKPAETCA